MFEHARRSAHEDHRSIVRDPERVSDQELAKSRLDRGDLQVDATELLHKLGPDTQHDTVEVAFLARREASSNSRDGLAVLVLDRCRFFLKQGVLDSGEFVFDLLLKVGSLVNGKLGQDGLGVFFSVVLE